MQCYERTSTTKAGTDFNHTNSHRKADVPLHCPPRLLPHRSQKSIPTAGRHCIHALLSISWMINDGGYDKSLYSEYVLWVNYRYKRQCTLGTSKK